MNGGTDDELLGAPSKRLAFRCRADTAIRIRLFLERDWIQAQEDRLKRRNNFRSVRVDHERFKRLIVEVEEPEKTRAMIERATR